MSNFVSQFKNLTAIDRAENKPVTAAILLSSLFNTEQAVEPVRMDDSNILAGGKTQVFGGTSFFRKTRERLRFLIRKIQLVLSKMAGTLILFVSPMLYFLVLTMIKVTYRPQKVY